MSEASKSLTAKQVGPKFKMAKFASLIMPCQCASAHGCEDEASCSAPSAPSLFQYIDRDYIHALNERRRGSAKTVFRPHHLRNQTEQFMESDDDDPQLIIRIPFTEAVKLSYIGIGMLQPGATTILRIFVNRSSSVSIDFSNVRSLPVTEEIALADAPSTVTFYPLQVSKYLAVEDLVIHFCETRTLSTNVSNSTIPLMPFYIGFYGVSSQLKKDPVIGVYEARPMLADHPCHASEHVSRQSFV